MYLIFLTHNINIKLSFIIVYLTWAYKHDKEIFFHTALQMIMDLQMF